MSVVVESCPLERGKRTGYEWGQVGERRKVCYGSRGKHLYSGAFTLSREEGGRLLLEGEEMGHSKG